MITLGPSRRYFLHRAPTDMRKSFDGLCGVVRRELGKNPLSGDVFVFVNRRRTHVKLLVWDRTGFALFYKRLEQGTFLVPLQDDSGPLAWPSLMLMLEGVMATNVRYRKRYSLPQNGLDDRFCSAKKRQESYLSDMAPEVLIEAYDGLKADNTVLRTQVSQAIAREAAMREEVAQSQAKVDQLAHESAQLKRALFGAKSERFEPRDPEQASLFEETSAEEEPAGTTTEHTVTKTKSTRRKPVRQVLPSHLKRTVVVIEPDVDTTGLRRIGTEVTETLDYEPAKLTVLRRERPKYVDPADESRGVIMGSLPPRPIERGIAEAGLLAGILVEKYLDHLPLYRQVQRFARQGLRIPSSTIGDWTAKASDLLAPLYEALTREAHGSGYIQADETGIPVQDADTHGKTHSGYYWVYHAVEKGLVVVDYQKRRTRAGPLSWLTGYAGALQSDGYAAYDEFCTRKEITGYACWAHARRHIFEAKDSSPKQAEHALREIQRLYAIERRLREAEAAPEERRRVRQEEALPILDAFKSWLEANRGLPKNPWGKAVYYVLIRWDKLARYTQDGRIEIDNNLCENAIRPIALGRRNYLFAGSHDAARRGAMVYSLLGTCKKHGVNPFEWLSDVLNRIPAHPYKRVDKLLPHRWKRKG